MKKSILLLITILMMIFGITTNVYAETCQSNFVNSVHSNMLNYTSNITNGLNANTKYLPNNETFTIESNYRHLKGTLWYTIVANDQVISNINLETTCTSSHLENMVPDMVITYADGTHADIDGSTYEKICDSWETRQVNKTLTLSTQSEITMVGLRLIKNDNGWYSCFVDSSGNFDCPINGGGTFKGFTFLHTLSNNSNAQVKYGFVSGQFYKCENDTQQIINNQNQNTNTISNNITNLNDNIISTNISSDTTTNTTNISDNNINADSKNVVLDFMLMPINFIRNILNSFNSTCATLCLGNCTSGHDNEWYFVLPCVDIRSIVGDTIYNTIDVLMCFGMVFGFLSSVVNFIKRILILESDTSTEVRILS